MHMKMMILSRAEWLYELMTSLKLRSWFFLGGLHIRVSEPPWWLLPSLL